ncbi:MAG: hypothetical protein DHS20C01_02540 [marine bacterium B5-7]|nr:MAG: hypothetical protein DHS20C01_02540 [marine bacterium B5-7]
MPAHIKFIVSVLTLLVGAGFFYFERLYADPKVALVGAALSIGMVLAMWIFPEAGGNSRR